MSVDGPRTEVALHAKGFSLGRVVRPTIATADEQPVHLPVLSVQEHSAAVPAGVIYRVAACY